MWRFGANKACCLPAFLHLPAALHLLDTDPLEGWGFVDDGIPSLLCKHSHGENSQTKEERVPRNSCCLHTFFLLDQALLQEFFEITQVVYLRIIVLGWIWSLESEKPENLRDQGGRCLCEQWKMTLGYEMQKIILKKSCSLTPTWQR